MTMFHQNVRPFVTFWGNKVINFSMEHGHFSNFCGAWSFLEFCWNMVILIFGWSMVASQIFVEHGCFSNCGGTWSLLIFLVEHGRFSNFGGTWSFFEKTLNCRQAGPKIKCSTKIWGHLSHFGGARSFLFFDGAWSLLKFWWNTVIFIFWWSMVAFQIFRWSMVASQIFVEHGFSSNLLAPVISLPLHSDWYALVNIQSGGGMQ